MSKRYRNPALHAAKETFVNHISYILANLNVKTTQREIAMLCGVSVSAICAVKNGHGQHTSLDTLMKIARALRLDYTITLTGKLGKERQTVQVESGSDYIKAKRVAVNDKGVITTKPFV